MAAPIGIPTINTFNDAELAFCETIFSDRGSQGRPTEVEFRQGLEVMSALANQVEGNPSEGGSYKCQTLGIDQLTDDERRKTAVVAFMRFAVTTPTSWQWKAAHEQLFTLVHGQFRKTRRLS